MHILPRTERLDMESMRTTATDHSLGGSTMMKTYRWTKQPCKHRPQTIRLTQKQIEKLYEQGKVVRRF